MTEWATVTCLFMTYDYDPMGRVLNREEVQPSNCYAGHPISNTYDLMGNMTSQTDGNFHTATYTYNTAARITSVTDSLNNPSAGQPPNLFSPGSCSKQYDAAGRLLCATTGYGEVESYTYDKRGRQTSSSITLNGVTIYSFNITSFAPNGNVLAVNDSSNGNWTYAYDSFNRLTCANLASNGTCSAPTSGTPTYSYVYDRFGNRWQQNGPHAFTATFTGNNPSNPANNNRIDGYTYDSAGNLINDGVHTYTYDAENRLIQVDAGNTAIYTYDGEGHRFSKDDTTSVKYYPPDPQGTTEFVYDPQGHLVHTEAPNGGTGWRGEVFLGNRHLATYIGNVVFNHSDWLGTERHRDYVTPSTNQLYQQSLTSLPFGDWLDNTQGFVPEGDPLNFTGQYHDFESDLDYFGARYYGSNTGRFMSPDPDNAGASLDYPQSWNAYSYALNNPIINIDPNGKDCIHINNDTGKFEGFERGDCDNSTEEKANSGYYVDGTVNNLFSTTGDSQGVVKGYSATNGDSGTPTLISGTFSTPTPADSSDTLNPFAAAVFGDVFSRLRWMDPEVCGGGYFVLRGKEVEGVVAHGGGYGIVTHDSRSGVSGGFLAEGGGGPFSVGHEQAWSYPRGERESSTFLMAGLGDHLGGFAAFSNPKSPIQVGGYATLFGRGGGAYANLVPGNGCHK